MTEQNPTLPPWTAPPTPIRPRPPHPVKHTAPQPKPKATHTMLRFNLFAVLLVGCILASIALVNGTVEIADVMWALSAGAVFSLIGILVHFHEPKRF